MSAAAPLLILHSAPIVLEQTLLTLIERPDVCVGFVCWLRLDFVLVLFVLVLVSVP
jgi:hypothetical protein